MPLQRQRHGDEFEYRYYGQRIYKAYCTFALVDANGIYFQCCAIGRNAGNLEEGLRIALYFGTGRAAIGSAPGALYAYEKDSAIVALNRRNISAVLLDHELSFIGPAKEE